MKPDLFLAAAIKTVRPLPLNSLTLPPIIMLPELEDRPELIVPLLAPLERCEDVPIEVWVRAVALAGQAGRFEQARRIYHKHVIPFLSKQIKNAAFEEESVELGLKLDPSAVLRLFRQTRPRSAKSDEQESPNRRKFIAQAHEALGRRILARRLQRN